MILLNCLTEFSEEVVDRVERKLSAMQMKMPVLLKPCAGNSAKVTMAGWTPERGPVCYLVDKDLFCDPERSAELERQITEFVRLVRR